MSTFEAVPLDQFLQERPKELDTSSYWKRLEEENPEDFKAFWFPEARKSYLKQGIEFISKTHEKGVDTIMFLDKSARPLAGFFRALWRRMYDDEPPEMRFMSPDVIDGGEQAAEVFKASKAVFDGKRILIVDELILSGQTLLNARATLEDAFPGAERILIGGLAAFNHEREKLLDIKPPAPSRTTAATLGLLLYGTGKEQVEEVPGKILVRANRKMSASKTRSARLREVGLTETLDDQSLEVLNERSDIDEQTKDDLRAAYIRVLGSKN